MRLTDTLRPLAWAVAAATVTLPAISLAVRVSRVGALGDMLRVNATLVLFVVVSTLYAGFFFAVAAGVFVFPVLAMAPALRRPPVWVAAIWGAALSSFLDRITFAESWYDIGAFAIIGAAGGGTYAMAARSSPVTITDPPDDPEEPEDEGP